MPSLSYLSRRGFITSAVAAGSAFMLGANKASTRRPNIIFILTDDMGYGDQSIYEQTKLRTPRIDRRSSAIPM